MRPSTLELTALDLRDDSARRSQSIGAVKPPRRNAGSVLCVSTSLALIAATTLMRVLVLGRARVLKEGSSLHARWFILVWSLAQVRTPGPLPPDPRLTLCDLNACESLGARSRSIARISLNRLTTIWYAMSLAALLGLRARAILDARGKHDFTVDDLERLLVISCGRGERGAETTW